MLGIAFDLKAAVRLGRREHPAPDPAIRARRSDRAGDWHRASGPPLLRQRRNIEQYAPVFDADLERPDLTAVGALRFTIREADHPVVERAGHGVTVHDALAERATFVGTAILESENPVVGGAEQRDTTE